MPELRNSTRSLHKATYAPVVPRDNARDQTLQQQTGRAIEKVAFVRSLSIQPAELETLRSRVAQGGDAALRPKILAAIDTVAPMVADTSPGTTLQLAQQLAAIEPAALTGMGQQLAAQRAEISTQVKDAVQALHQKFVATIPSSLESHAAFAPNAPVAEPAAPGPVLAAAAKPRAAMAAVARPPLNQVLDWAAAAHPEEVRTLDEFSRRYGSVPVAYAMMAGSATDRIARFTGSIDWWGSQTDHTVHAFAERMAVEPIGRLHLERLEMTPVGIERGELVHSVPLTPSETVNISHKEWSIQSSEFETIVQDFFEGYSEEGVAEKNDVSHASESESKHSTALNVGASLSASYSSVTLSTSFGYDSKSDDTQSQKDSRTHSSESTRKASARTRKDHKTTFKVTSAAGAEDETVRIITNPSDTEAMRVDYYQLMRKWRVNLLRYGLRMTYDIVIPSPGSELIQKLEELKQLDDQIDTPFDFQLTLSDIDPNHYEDLVVRFKTVIDKPPDLTKQLQRHAEFKAEDPTQAGYGAIDLEVDASYTVESGHLGAIYQPSNDDQEPADPNNSKNSIFDVLGQPPGPSIGWGGYGSSLNNLKGRSGKLAVVYTYKRIKSGAVDVILNLRVEDSVIKDWTVKAWGAARQAALEDYLQSRQTLKERRAKLADEIAAFDALTLRRMEQEAIMKGVLRWLFGPTFELVPAEIQKLFDHSATDDPELAVVDPTAGFSGAWEAVLGFGEFIKYLHDAIEWENVLYFNYPYFWDHPKNWPFKRFLTHPDPTHRIFLRSGAARVVLTIRPGFEDSFAALMASGTFTKLPGDHPYVTISQDIQNFAKTNYPGISPANPEQNVRMLLYPEQRKAWEDIQQIMASLESYAKAKGALPTTADGLAELRTFDNTVPTEDPWNNPYVYTAPAPSGAYELVSYGADGTPGGTDLDSDISSAAEASLIATWFEYTPTSALDVGLNTSLPNIA